MMVAGAEVLPNKVVVIFAMFFASASFGQVLQPQQQVRPQTTQPPQQDTIDMSKVPKWSSFEVLAGGYTLPGKVKGQVTSASVTKFRGKFFYAVESLSFAGDHDMSESFVGMNFGMHPDWKMDFDPSISLGAMSSGSDSLLYVQGKVHLLKNGPFSVTLSARSFVVGESNAVPTQAVMVGLTFFVF